MKQKYTNTLIQRRISRKNETSLHPTTNTKPPLRNSGPLIGHSSTSLEALNPRYGATTTHFGFLPKPETRPGAIKPTYVTPRMYRSARNMTTKNTSEQNIPKTQRAIDVAEHNVNSQTLPRGWKSKNRRNFDLEENKIRRLFG